MPCSKTGCQIYLRPYKEYAWGDAYVLGEVAYFRIVQQSHQPLFSHLHYTVDDYDCWFDRGERVSTMVTMEWQSHGYEGEELLA